MNMKTFLLVAALIFAGIVLAVNIKSDQESYTDNSRPSDAVFPSEKKANDKMVIVKNASYEDVKMATEEFLNRYNQRRYQTVIELKKISFNEFALTFPYDINFNTFLYFVNYLHYPKGVMYKPEITAWSTAKSGDPWTMPGMEDKVAMIYIPNGVELRDAMVVTTSDNLSFKLGFAFKAQNEKLDMTPMQFHAPGVTPQDLSAMPGEEIF